MDEFQLQGILIALLLPILALCGLGIAVGFDPYLRRDKKRALLLIEAIVLTLIIDNCAHIALTAAWKSEYVFLKTCVDVYSYVARPVLIVLFIYTVWDDPRRRLFWIPVGLNAAVFLTALVKPWAFCIHPDGRFFRGPLGYTAHWVSGFLLLSMLVIVLALRARNGWKATIIPLTNVGVAALGPLLDAQFHGNGLISFTEITTVYCCVFYYIWLHQEYVREHEQALREGQRVQLMLSQIKPHFLHNALTVIVGLCDTDPRRARQATLKFAKYLRGNMASIEQAGLIPFERELEHTRLYLEIEQFRFGEALEVHYDIACDGFGVPALTVEPLAENAVRHGVRENPGGRGTVTIAARETPDYYEISVTDDGPGFNPDRLRDDGENHVGIVAATLAATLVGMIEPRVYSLVTGTILKNHNMNLMIGLGVFLLCSAFAGQMIGLIRSLLMERISTKTSQAVEASVMIRILSLPVSFFRKYSSGELSSRAESVKSLCGMLLNNIFSVGLSSLMSLLYVAQIFSFAPALVWPSLAVILATVVLSVSASLVQMGVARKQMTLAAEESGMSYAMLSGVQKVRLSGSEKRTFARWGRLYAKKAQLEYNPPLFLKLNGVITTAISLIGTIVLYFLAVKTGVSESQYYAFTAAYGRVMGAFTALAGIAISVASIRPMLEMAEPILKAEPEVAAERLPLDHVSGHIELRHVTFRYEENAPYVLNDLSLEIKAGEYVAIVGRTGCGKSTLVRLLLGFETPEKGAVLYDQHDLQSIDPRSLRKHIGVVIQNGQLFQGDIFSNIAISAPQLTLDEAWEVAQTAGIAQDIREMPMGMQTLISEGQGGISGGQKQRLMIARAIAPKPKILIFDEATSALDNKTQKQVSDALDGLNCTRIVIAHRLSTIRNCDRILVMDRGAIIEEGTYDELIEQDGYFAELVARQRLDT